MGNHPTLKGGQGAQFTGFERGIARQQGFGAFDGLQRGIEGRQVGAFAGMFQPETRRRQRQAGRLVVGGNPPGKAALAGVNLLEEARAAC